MALKKKSWSGRPLESIQEELASCRKELELMNLELEIYREIGGLVVKGAPRDRLIGCVLDYTLKALKGGSVALYLFDDVDRSLRAVAFKGPLAAGHAIRRGSTLAAAVARTGKPRLSGPKAGPGARQRLAVPLVNKRRVTGVIEALGGQRPFTGADLGVLSSLSNHFSILMERARLFSELDGRIRQFSMLNQVGNLLISTLDQSVVRRRAMEAITGLMRAETGSLLLVDNDSGDLYFEVALGRSGKKLEKVRLSPGEGIAGWVAQHGKPVIIPDVTRDRRFQGKIDKRSRFKTRNMICVPVRIKGRIIGVLQAINSLDGTFTAEDLKLFGLLANQVAIALDNARLYTEIQEAFYATSAALAEAIEKRDPYTGGHTKRVLEYCLAIAGELKLPQESLDVLKLSAVLHDIGKIGIEDRILKKQAPLSPEEAASMRLHPQYGAEILKHIPQLSEIVPGMLHHHERVDGQGYPKGYKDEEIPLVARIISVADTYDAMTTTRPYRGGLPVDRALKELKKHSGRQFDRKVVNAFFRALRNGGIKCGGAKREVL